MFKPKESKPSSAQWQRLYELAQEIYTMKPWQWMWDKDIFAISDPLSDDMLYICVMGRNGEHLSIAAYIGVQGFTGLNILFQMEMNPDSYRTVDLLNAQTCLQAIFQPIYDVDPQDVSRAREYGWQDRSMVCEFESFLPGYPPWTITKDEATRLIATLEQTLNVAPRFKKTETLFTGLPEDRLFARIKTTGNLHEWQDGSAEISFPVLPDPMLETGVLGTSKEYISLVAGMPPGNAVWEADVVYAQGSIDGRPYILRPYFPKLAMLLDHDSYTAYDMRLMTPHHHDEQIAKMCVKACQQTGSLPREIIVGDDSLKVILKQLVQGLSITVSFGSELPAIDEAVAHMDEYLGKV
ncbi:MAG: hypothetical protein HYV41_01665 [Candidatus Magasanikbacteria bacterium]|nr:hypothetical protein [Candidatus Magasanikbacteria bacterium]